MTQIVNAVEVGPRLIKMSSMDGPGLVIAWMLLILLFNKHPFPGKQCVDSFVTTNSFSIFNS